tara:strand:- start:18 stop:245 length:228 start_codon:yes stop_codon:yes gene_type:complete
MRYLTHLKKYNHCHSCRWIVKFNSKTDLVREVKLIYSPNEYREMNEKRYGENARKLQTKKQLIKILENDKEKRKL